MKQLRLTNWSSYKLVFMDRIEKICKEQSVAFHADIFSHHPDWMLRKRMRHLRNIFFLAKQIYNYILMHYMDAHVLFGTNLCRLVYPFLFFRRDVFFIYNEFPSSPAQSFLLYLYDALIFHTVKHVFVSSEERKKIFEFIYGVPGKLGIVNNLSYGTANVVHKEVLNDKEERLIFAGLISRERITFDAIKLLNKSPVPIVFVGKTLEPEILNSITSSFEYLGEVSQDESIELQKRYKYALVSYGQHDLNNDFCAPIKLYEYVANCCVVVSIGKNQGLMKKFSDYPALFCWYEDFAQGAYKFNQIEYIAQRNKFLAEAEAQNEYFYKQIRWILS